MKKISAPAKFNYRQPQYRLDYSRHWRKLVGIFLFEGGLILFSYAHIFKNSVRFETFLKAPTFFAYGTHRAVFKNLPPSSNTIFNRIKCLHAFAGFRRVSILTRYRTWDFCAIGICNMRLEYRVRNGQYSLNKHKKKKIEKKLLRLPMLPVR